MVRFHEVPVDLDPEKINKAGYSLDITGNLGEELARQVLYIQYGVDKCVRQGEGNTEPAPQGIRIPGTDNGSADLMVKSCGQRYYIEVKSTLSKSYYKGHSSPSQYELWSSGHTDYLIQIRIDIADFRKGLIRFSHQLKKNPNSEKPSLEKSKKYRQEAIENYKKKV